MKLHPRFNVTGIVIILACAAISLVLSIAPYSAGAVVTLSVNARTESLQVQLKANRHYAWRLPPGTVALLAGGGKACDDVDGEQSCEFQQNLTLQVSGGPSLTLESMPDGKFMFTLAPAEGRRMQVKMLGQSGEELGATNELLFYESQSGAPETRLPLIIESAVIGALLYESAGDMGGFDSTWQPMLREGTYSVFASVGAERDRFQLLDGFFDSGDVITMRARSADETESIAASVWGHLSIEPASEGGPHAAPILSVILNTPFPELDVQRFGAPEGYKIAAPPWLVISELPIWQSTWVIFISLLVIYDVYCAAAERNSGRDINLRRLFGRRSDSHDKPPSHDD